MFLFSNTLVNVAATLGLVLVYLGVATLINKRINTIQETGKKGMVWWYLLLLVLLVIAVFVALWFFDIDLVAILQGIWESLQTLIVDSVGAIITTVLTLFIASLLIRVTNYLVKRAISRESEYQKRITTIMKLVKSIVKYAIYLIAILVVLSAWGVDVLPALAGLGILGLVIGMGAQSLVKDIIAGFFIIIEHQYDVGDIVEINGFKGEVIDIGLKSTKIRNWKKDVNIVSNGSIGGIVNFSTTPSVAVIKLGVSYESDVQKVLDILNKELPKYTEQYPEVTDAPNVLGVTGLGDSSVDITILVPTKTEQHYGVERNVQQAVKEICDKHDIEIPYPHVTVTNK